MVAKSLSARRSSKSYLRKVSFVWWEDKTVLQYLEILAVKVPHEYKQWSLPSSYATSLGHHLSQPK